MTPPRGAYFAVLSTADAISSRLVISVLKNMTFNVNVSSIVVEEVAHSGQS